MGIVVLGYWYQALINMLSRSLEGAFKLVPVLTILRVNGQVSADFVFEMFVLFLCVFLAPDTIYRMVGRFLKNQYFLRGVVGFVMVGRYVRIAVPFLLQSPPSRVRLGEVLHSKFASPHARCRRRLSRR